MTESLQETGSPPQTPVQRDDRWVRLLPMIILVFVTVAVFWPVLGHQFLAYDDSVDVYKNPYLQARSLDNLLHFWRYPYEGLYTPLTYTLYALAAWAPALLTDMPSAAVAPDPRLFSRLQPVTPPVERSDRMAHPRTAPASHQADRGRYGS